MHTSLVVPSANLDTVNNVLYVQYQFTSLNTSEPIPEVDHTYYIYTHHITIPKRNMAKSRNQ